MSKYPRSPHFSFSPGAKNDDRITDSNLHLVGKEIVITEKLDGSNSAHTNQGVYARSHVDFSRNPWDRQMWLIHNRIKNDLGEGVFLFGENMEGIHSIEYSNLSSYLYIFGIRDNDIWSSWETVEEYSYLLDIPTVPVLFKGVIESESELKSIIESLSNKPSELGGIREGVVVRNANSFHSKDFSTNLAKFVRKDHVQTDQHWTRNWRRSKLII